MVEEQGIWLASGIVDRSRNLHFQTIQFRGQHNLATEPWCVAQIIGQIEHVHLLVARLRGQPIVVRLAENQMTRGARKRSLARSESVQIDVIVDDHVEQAVAHFASGCQSFAARSDERHSNARKWNPLNRIERKQYINKGSSYLLIAKQKLTSCYRQGRVWSCWW